MRTHIRPVRGLQSPGFAELWRYRDLFWEMAMRDVRLRYRQTVLGVAWVVLQPLLGAGILSFVFGSIAPGSTTFLVSFVGLLGWNVFSGTLLKAATSLMTNSSLVSKVFFPRLLLPFSTSVSTLIDFAVSLVMLLMILVLNGVLPGLSMLLAPLWIAIIMGCGMGIGLVCGALSVRFRDVNHILPVVLNFMLYASPVAYGLSRIPDKLRDIVVWNPLSYPLEGLRSAMLGTGTVSLETFVFAGVSSVVLLLGGIFIFKYLERDFADVI